MSGWLRRGGWRDSAPGGVSGLGGGGDGPSHSTVKHHLANARSKVGATTTAQLVWILAPRLPEAEGTSSTDE